MAIKNQFKAVLQQENINLKEAVIIVACSAGPDSMALVDLLYRVLANPQKQLIIAHVDHQLRSDSKDEVAILKAYCLTQSLILENYLWDKKLQPTQGVEASAREMRYHFFDNLAKKYQADYVMTAHHGDDVVETILQKLIRSGDAKEMASLANRRKLQNAELVRPLLNFSKQELLAYNQGHQIKYIDDKTNDTDFTMRNRIRHHVMPVLRKETAHLVDNGQRYQKSIRDLVDAQMQLFELVNDINQQTSHLFVGKIKEFTKIPQTNWPDYLSYLTMTTFSDKVFLSKQQEIQLKHILTNEGSLTVTKNINFSVKASQYFITKKKQLIQSKEVKLETAMKYDGQTILLSEQPSHVGFRKIDSFFVPFEETLFLGYVPDDKKIMLPNGQHQKVKKVFAKQKIPTFLKSYYLSVYGTDIYWIQENYHYNSLSKQCRKLYFFVAK